MLDFKLCEHCGRDFFPKRYWQIYCSANCKFAAHYARKIQKSTGVLDVLDIQDGPTELQIADRKRRVEGREEQERERQVIQDSKVVERALEMSKKIAPAVKPMSLEEMGYGNMNEDIYAKPVRKREEDAEDAKGNQGLGEESPGEEVKDKM